jgi:hypothetical protein
MSWVILIIVVIVIVIVGVVSSEKHKETKEEMRTRGWSESDFKDTGAKYAGGHPKADNVIEHIWYRIKDGNLMFYLRETAISLPQFKFEIPISAISDIQYNDATTMEKKITAGRLLLVGVFAFAWKKKKEK